MDFPWFSRHASITPKEELVKNIVFTLLILIGTFPALAADGEQTESAYSWLELIDTGKYDESWNLSGSFFKGKLSRDQWLHALTEARKPLGDLRSREVSSVTETGSMPGAPDGEYVIFIFTSSFEGQDLATETLTLTKENDEWRPVGYFIR